MHEVGVETVVLSGTFDTSMRLFVVVVVERENEYRTNLDFEFKDLKSSLITGLQLATFLIFRFQSSKFGKQNLIFWRLFQKILIRYFRNFIESLKYIFSRLFFVGFSILKQKNNSMKFLEIH